MKKDKVIEKLELSIKDGYKRLAKATKDRNSKHYIHNIEGYIRGLKDALEMLT